MYKEKKYVLAGYQQREFNFFMGLWLPWMPCNKAYYDHVRGLKPPVRDSQVREIYALED